VETPFDSILSKVTNKTVFVWHCSPEARGEATTADKMFTQALNLKWTAEKDF
jgi:hypothetical protein